MRPRVCDAGACEASRLCAGLNSSLRLGPVTRLFDLSTPQQTYLVRAGGPHRGDELKALNTRTQPQEDFHQGRPCSAPTSTWPCRGQPHRAQRRWFYDRRWT